MARGVIVVLVPCVYYRVFNCTLVSYDKSSGCVNASSRSLPNPSNPKTLMAWSRSNLSNLNALTPSNPEALKPADLLLRPLRRGRASNLNQHLNSNNITSKSILSIERAAPLVPLVVPCIYIYIYRERERERERYTYIHIYIYIYI